MNKSIFIAATTIVLSACNEKAIDTKAEGEKAK